MSRGGGTGGLPGRGELRAFGAEPYLPWGALLNMSSKDKPYDEATKVSAEDGEVILDGPDGVDVRLTPEAAEETSENLLEGAAMAAGQRKLEDLPHKPG
jgi:hypothetical protein